MNKVSFAIVIAFMVLLSVFNIWYLIYPGRKVLNHKEAYEKVFSIVNSTIVLAITVTFSISGMQSKSIATIIDALNSSIMIDDKADIEPGPPYNEELLGSKGVSKQEYDQLISAYNSFSNENYLECYYTLEEIRQKEAGDPGIIYRYAVLNLSYLYANGIGTGRDVKKAKELVAEFSGDESGEFRRYSVYLDILYPDTYNSVIGAIAAGISLRDRRTMIFTASSISDVDMSNAEDRKIMDFSFSFINSTYEDQVNYLSKTLVESYSDQLLASYRAASGDFYKTVSMSPTTFQYGGSWIIGYKGTRINYKFKYSYMLKLHYLDPSYLYIL